MVVLMGGRYLHVTKLAYDAFRVFHPAIDAALDVVEVDSPVKDTEDLVQVQIETPDYSDVFIVDFDVAKVTDPRLSISILRSVLVR